MPAAAPVHMQPAAPMQQAVQHQQMHAPQQAQPHMQGHMPARAPMPQQQMQQQHMQQQMPQQRMQPAQMAAQIQPHAQAQLQAQAQNYAQNPRQMMGHNPQVGMAAPQQPQHVEMPGAAESKSLIGKLMKRAPKAPQMPQVVTENPLLTAAAAAPVAATVASSGSLFNKNFLLGAVTGLVVGAFVLPMVLDQFGLNKAPLQSQAQALGQALPEFDPNAPVIVEQGEAFIDAAIETAKP